ncbi:MAG: cupin domain-containing protein [Myxococcota bacterium]
MINLRDKLALFDDLWAPRVVAEMNEVQFKVVKLQGTFVWHQHDDTDEVFLVVQGQMAIEMRDQTVHLREGEMYGVPRGVQHRPVASEVCSVLLVEPRGVVNTGDAESELTAEGDVWI